MSGTEKKAPAKKATAKKAAAKKDTTPVDTQVATPPPTKPTDAARDTSQDAAPVDATLTPEDTTNFDEDDDPASLAGDEVDD